MINGEAGAVDTTCAFVFCFLHQMGWQGHLASEVEQKQMSRYLTWVSSFFGSLNAPILVVILPPLIATQCLKPSNKTGRYYTIAFAGLVMSALGVTGAVSDIVSGNASGGERR